MISANAVGHGAICIAAPTRPRHRDGFVQWFDDPSYRRQLLIEIVIKLRAAGCEQQRGRGSQYQRVA